MIVSWRKQLTWCLFALMLVIVRTADAHAHLCQDGKEPPASIHLADGGAHACEEGSQGHSGDEDVSFTHDVVLKKSSIDDLWIPLAVAFVILRGDAPSEEPAVGDLAPVRISAPHFLRPPLRGPPA
ncbi:MAG TPA: hypothetical protein VMF52_03910 [Steroidobacteraceae bacterium]|nr:hypothetical protein [Steroidobacteraceae bacterium]